LDSAAGAGVASSEVSDFAPLLVDVPFFDVLFFFVEVAGFRAESDLDLLVAA
jgi:hypothetical protein